MNSYYQLYDYLRAVGQDKVSIPFSELEAILGFALPMSAYTYRAWWANGGHSQANTWLRAGYKVDGVDFSGQVVMFSRTYINIPYVVEYKKTQLASAIRTEALAINPESETVMACGYEFHFVQYLIPKCDTKGNILKYYPQNKYNNEKGLPLSYHGKGAFCRFSINAGDWPGVYLWVIDGQIIYIGETINLQQRFNKGYGTISPRNCYIGGQNTNCKMNKIILDYHELGKIISLYFYPTMEYKLVELELLKNVNTLYNTRTRHAAD